MARKAKATAKPAATTEDLASSADLDRLAEAAARARAHAYAPYSRFKVGAAVLAGSGAIYPGCNVENASYGLTLCAERAAVAAAVAAGEARILAAAVVTGAARPAPPCGLCLQTLAEFGPADAAVVLATLRGEQQRATLRQLLPFAFDRSFL